jgi:hypothetical protein
MEPIYFINKSQFTLTEDVVAVNIRQMAVIIKQLLFSLLFCNDIYLNYIDVTRISYITRVSSSGI